MSILLEGGGTAQKTLVPGTHLLASNETSVLTDI